MPRPTARPDCNTVKTWRCQPGESAVVAAAVAAAAAAAGPHAPSVSAAAAVAAGSWARADRVSVAGCPSPPTKRTRRARSPP